MLTIATYVGRVQGATVWAPIATEETGCAADAHETFFAAVCLFEAAKPWGGDERGVLSSATEIAIREAA